jgi:hypothetical protein
MKFLPLEEIAKAAERPVVLFLDELDKPRKESRSTVLELLWEKRLRGVRLHPQTVLIAAMQPVDEAWASDEDMMAITARLLFLPVTHDWSFLERRWGVDMEYFRQRHTPQVKVPTSGTASLRQVNYLLSLVARYPDLLIDREEDLVKLAAGLLPAADVTPFIKTLGKLWQLKPEIIAEDPEAVRKVIAQGKQESLMELAPYVLVKCPDPEAWPLLLDRLVDLDPTNRLVEQAYYKSTQYLFEQPPYKAPERRQVAWLSDPRAAQQNMRKFIEAIRKVRDKSMAQAQKEAQELEAKARARK